MNDPAGDSVNVGHAQMLVHIVTGLAVASRPLMT